MLALNINQDVIREPINHEIVRVPINKKNIKKANNGVKCKETKSICYTYRAVFVLNNASINNRFPLSWYEVALNRIIPSSYALPGMSDAIMHFETNFPNHHILCLTYKSFGDTQFGITETYNSCDKGNLMQTAVRGLQEEAGIIINSNNPVEAGLKYMFDDEIIWSSRYGTKYYSLNLDDYNINIVDKPKSSPKKRDDNNEYKVCILVHGNFNIIRNKMSEFQTNESDVMCCTAIPVRLIRRILNIT